MERNNDSNGRISMKLNKREFRSFKRSPIFSDAMEAVENHSYSGSDHTIELPPEENLLANKIARIVYDG